MKITFPDLNTERCLLRKIADKDLQKVYEGLSNPDVIRYYGISYSSSEAAKEQLQYFRDLEENETGYWWAITRKSHDDFAGAIGFNNWSRQHQKAEIGFWLLPAFWKQGLIREVLPVICEFGCTGMQLHRIEAWVEAGNVNCIKAITGHGFKHEGTLQDVEIKDGRFISLHIFAKLEQSFG